MGQYYYPIIFCYDEEGEVKILAWFASWNFGNGAKLTEHSYVGNDFVGVVENLLSPDSDFYNQRLVWAGDYANNEPSGKNLYHMAVDNYPDRCCSAETLKDPDAFPYIVNHSKHQFVKKPESGEIHPLPLLTAEGNGRGGGDYHGPGEDQVGIWARDIISIEKTVPADYIELHVDFP